MKYSYNGCVWVDVLLVWGFILNMSYVAPTFFKLSTFQWRIRLFLLFKFFTQQAFGMILVETIQIYPS